MPKLLQRSAWVPFLPAQMFELVNDVERYPSFMTFCLGARIVRRENDSLTAELTLGFKALRHKVITTNRLVYPHRMTLTLVSGPFKCFDGLWQFEPENGGTRVSFSLSYEFSNALLTFTASPWMDEMAAAQVTAICQRAAQLYANNPTAERPPQ